MQNEYVYRLPTETEWEFVAKSGLPADYSYGFGGDFDPSYAWFYGNSNNRTHEVALKNGVPSPQDLNEYLYDMSGNVWQWTEDWYDSNYGLGEAQLNNQLNNMVTDPVGPSTGSLRVLRGGS